ncbi:hypothetical protein DW66_3533 [Pseudomonas putida]|nr:hypothetical protein DW66_3533 [Pseudomonas putida]
MTADDFFQQIQRITHVHPKLLKGFVGYTNRPTPSQSSMVTLNDLFIS